MVFSPTGFKGSQYQSAGSQGITKYGLFSKPSAPSRPPLGPITTPMPSPRPPPFQPPQPTPGQDAAAETGAPTSKPRPDPYPGSLPTQIGGTRPSAGGPMPAPTGPTMPSSPWRTLQQGVTVLDGTRPQLPGRGGFAPTPPKPLSVMQPTLSAAPAPTTQQQPLTSSTAQVQTAAPQGEMGGMLNLGQQGQMGGDLLGGAQGEMGGTLNLASSPATGGTMQASLADASGWLADRVGRWIDGAGEVAEPWVEGAGDVAAGATGTFADQLAKMQDAWDAAFGDTSTYGTDQMMDLLSQFGFQGNSLLDAVGQNMTTMMDPAAWEQMAANREANLHDTLMGQQNDQMRRLRDQSNRSGFDMGGTQAALYANTDNLFTTGQRDIFNDVLGHQMQAAGMAGDYALGLNAQDQQRYMQALALLGGAQSQDVAAFREDHPSFFGFMNDLLGAIGGQAGGGGDDPAMQALTGIVSNPAAMAALFAVLGIPLGI